MTTLLSERKAFGHPGIAPRWTRSAKEAVGTAYSGSSPVWFTIARGMLNEAYYPTVDRPQIRDLQFLVTDGATFFHDERRHLISKVEYLDSHGLGLTISSVAADGSYRLSKQIITDPHQACILIKTTVECRPDWVGKLRLFVLLAPHLEGGGAGNNGYVAMRAGRETLVANKGDRWLALGASRPFMHRSCGYVGRSDGWTDLADNYQLDWEFDTAEDGNIALTGELEFINGQEFVLGLAFGETLHNAVTTLSQSLGFSFADHRQRFRRQWTRAGRKLVPLAEQSGDGGRLYRVSHSLLIAHEDKTYPGATIASLSIPWGEVKGDEDLGGYHLVWTRDMVKSAIGLLASGNTEQPLRALIYLACAQRPDGGFHQNFWIDGQPYWDGIQLDAVAFPIILAWRLHQLRALRDFDPYPLVLRAAGYLIREGPATPQDRWEENSGYSPSTLAANIAALTCAACFAAERGDHTTAQFVHEYADFLERHVEAWTVTSEGSLVPGLRRHYIRIHPVDPQDASPDEDPNTGSLVLRNRAPGALAAFPAKNIVDAGFLELVRYGIRAAGDPLVEDSLKVVDAMLKVDTPFGPCWHRYNNDGYGESEGGRPYEGFGKGRAWPLLTGERAHYELAAGRDARPLISAMEAFAGSTGLLPEQVWDEPNRPEFHLFLGRPTGSAMPLMWAHAEYIKLLRSVRDGMVFDRLSPVVERYQGAARARPRTEVWKFNRRQRTIQSGCTLRVLADAAFTLRWTANAWLDMRDSASLVTSVGAPFVDIPVPVEQQAPIEFTFQWSVSRRWEGRNFSVAIADR
ncbi:MAG: glycoside hydrolase family 15 protein [Gemmatimonadaceae bacterium]